MQGKTILITGAARRIGKILSLSAAEAGANVIVHHAHSPQEADLLAVDLQKKGVQACVFQADFQNPESVESFAQQVFSSMPVDILVNSAAIFAPISLEQTSLVDWQQHLNVNLTAPFLLSQAFARYLPPEKSGKIINILDWRSLRPGKDHFPYTISKAALVSLTSSLAVALAPRITVNGLALGAMLPPSDGAATDSLLASVPANRWAKIVELEQAFQFLAGGPEYITGEIIHLDGGRHLV